MDELIVIALQGKASVEEEAVLARWCQECPANDRRYKGFARLWAITCTADWHQVAAGEPDVGRIVALAESPELEFLTAVGTARATATSQLEGHFPGEIEPRLDREPHVAREGKGRGKTNSGWKVAAMAATFVPVGVGLGMLLPSGGAPATPSVLEESEIVTGAGEMMTIALADGSTIRLGPRSILRLSQEGSNPVAWLDGRAFFAVRADTDRSFLVRTPTGEALVLGTRFEVRSEEDEFRVLVVDGSVNVTVGAVTAALGEGEMSRSLGGSPLSTQHIEDPFDHLEWMGNSLVFQSTSLDQAIREIQGRFGLEVVLAVPELRDLTVTATFQQETPGEVIKVLCEIVGVRCAEVEGGFVMGGQRGIEGVR